MICRICNKVFPDKKLGMHIARVHKMSAEMYYLKYLGKKGYCLSCGKPTKFITIEEGFGKYCSRKCSCTSKDRLDKCKATWISTLGVDNPSKSSKVKKSKEKTFKKHYGVTCSFKIPNLVKEGMLKSWGVKHPMDSKEIKNKLIQTNRRKRNVACVFQDNEVKSKIHKTMLEKYKVKYPMQSAQIKEKAKNTFLKNWNVEHPMKDSNHCSLIMNKVRKSIYDKYKVDSWAKTKEGRKFLSSINKDPIILRNKEATSLKHFGTKNPMQCPDVFKKVFSHIREKHHGYLSNSEYEFSKKLDKSNYTYTSEFYLNQHHFDFATYKNGKVNTLVEIDGEYCHGLLCDSDGHHARGEKDFLRFKNAYPYKLVVIDSKNIELGFVEFEKVYSLTYKEYRKRMIHQISKLDLKYSYSDKRIKGDYKNLYNKQINKNSRLGRSLVLNGYCAPSYLDIDKLVRTRKMYYSKVSSHNPLDGITDFSLDNLKGINLNFSNLYNTFKLIFNYKVHILTDYVAPIYDAFNFKELKDVRVPDFLKDMCNVVCRIYKQKINISTYVAKKIKLKSESNDVVLGFSGGLDSCYQALKLKQMGYSVHLFHLGGANTYENYLATKSSESFAHRYKFDLIETKIVKILNAQKVEENPVKNQLIMAMMIDYCASKGYNKISIGYSASLKEENAIAGINVTDCISVQDAFLKNIEIEFIPIKNANKGDRILYLNENKSLNYYYSCVSCGRFNEKLHHLNEDKYKVKLPRHNCGSCRKCARHYLLMIYLGIAPHNKDFEKHCWNILKDTKYNTDYYLFNDSLSKEEKIKNLFG